MSAFKTFSTEYLHPDGPDLEAQMADLRAALVGKTVKDVRLTDWRDLIVLFDDGTQVTMRPTGWEADGIELDFAGS